MNISLFRLYLFKLLFNTFCTFISFKPLLFELSKHDQNDKNRL